MDFLSSTQNQRVKDLVKLQEKSSERLASQQFVVEGFREVQRALLSDYRAISIFYFENLDPGELKLQQLLKTNPGIIPTRISQAVFQKLAYRESSDGFLAVFSMKEHKLSSLVLPENPLIIVLEAVEKPGNLGAILRTCDGAGVDAVIVCDSKTDIYNPNCIRSSLGCLFSVQLAIDSTERAIEYFQNKKIKTFAASLSAKQNYFSTDFKHSTALVLGTEALGLSEEWISKADTLIKIPMNGIADSLNVSISAAVLVYEAIRQRNMSSTEK